MSSGASEWPAVNQWPLVGRTAEVAAIVELLDRVPPAAVVVAGPAGVGKSRVLREVADWAAGHDWTVHRIVGTRAAASIPFGAVAALLADRLDDASSVEILAHARRVLTTNDGRPPPLLVVDDAQRLDAASATVVHQVVTAGIGRLVATVRTGEPAADAIETLWTSGIADRIELGGLSQTDVGDLLTAVLGGTVDGATIRRLWESTRGNVLYLKELVLDARASSALQDDGGIWRLRGPGRTSPRLVELIGARLSALGPPARAALDIVAVAERIDLDELATLTDISDLEHLELDELIAVSDDDSGHPVVSLAHPLYGDAILASMPALRRRRVCGAVADAVEAAGMRRQGDLVRVATWRLDAGQPVDSELLTTAARRAYNAHALVLAERLATAARAAGGGVAAGLVLAETELVVGRHHDAAALLDQLAHEATTDEQRVQVADCRAITLGLYLGREREALDVVNETLAVVRDPELADPLLASLSIVLAQAPKPAAAIEAARPLLERPASPSFHRGAYAASLARALAGELDDAIAIGQQGHEAHLAVGSAVRFLPEGQFIGPILAMCGAGRCAEADELAQRGYDAAVAAQDADLQASFALLSGLVAVHRGRLVVATRWFSEAAAVNREINDVAGLRWALGGIALAGAMRGDAGECADAVAELASAELPPVQLFELDLVERGRAWEMVATGERTRGLIALRSAADRASAAGLVVVEALLRHDLARLGDAKSEADRLAELAPRIDGALAGVLAAHAGALVSGDGHELAAVSDRFAALGADLLAAEAAVDAAAALRVAGLRRKAAEYASLAERLMESCGDVRSTAMPVELDLVALTEREREVATMAARGLSSREIANTLFLSPRTVENHLQRIYDKLGIAGREHLAEALR